MIDLESVNVTHQDIGTETFVHEPSTPSISESCDAKPMNMNGFTDIDTDQYAANRYIGIIRKLKE